ncbi:MAG: SMC-Scp complex subunit ScpB [Candidatus Nanohaloarchaea archaeon]|nr:SMC-Scp complex subunit ScpB [Candidatus Nanohaloarchaea archaeon]
MSRTPVEGSVIDDKKAVAEAALYLSEEPLDTDDLADVMNLGSRGYVQEVIDDLKQEVEEDSRGLTLVESDAGYELVVKSSLVEQVEHLAPHRDLNDAELRTLALVAYNAPVKQSDVVEVRGNRAYTHVKELQKRGFIDAEEDGRTKQLDVTEHFLDYFDLDSPDEFVEDEEEQDL